MNRNHAAFLAVSVGMAAAGAAGMATTASADVVSVTAMRDATIYSENDESASGAGDYFFAGRNNGVNLRRGLVRFDVSAIPPGSTINSATLTLYMSRTIAGDQPVHVHRVLADWGEGASNADGQEGGGAAAQLNDATWRYRFFNPADPGSSPQWATLGGDFVGGASASSTIGMSNGFYAWTGPGLAGDVSGWANNAATNFGWILLGNESEPATSKRFNSRTSSNTGRRPMLTINFTPPASVGACCFGDGTCALLSLAQCGTQGGTYQGNGSTCSPNPCPQPTGACCFGDGSCVALSPIQCAAQAGTYQANGTVCIPNPCPQLTGACCFDNASCLTLTQADCLSQGGTFMGELTDCGAVACPLVLEPFVDELPRAGVAQPVSGVPGGAAHYEIAIREAMQQLHRDLPPTRIWGYAGLYPGPTIEARRDQTVTVTWINDLRYTETGELRTTHALPVDTCLHGPDMTGEVPVTVVHVHGANVASDSDGHPDHSFPPGQQSTVYTYPNNQPAATIWYHDHALGITRLNVYMGMAAFYLIRDDAEDALNLPRGEFEIAMAIQDRSFNPDGSFKYLDMWHEHFFGDVALVNGKVWPYLNVKRGKYRFRIVAGSGSRAYTLALSNGAAFWQIGSDTGLLEAPVAMTSLTLTPGERADVVMDFAAYAPGAELILTNSAATPFPNGGIDAPLPQIMKFIVQDEPGDTDPLPVMLVPVPRIPESQAVMQRDFDLRKMAGHGCPEHTDGTWMINGLMWDDITEFPRVGDTEIWAWVNRSGVTHPMHMHLVSFQVLDRQDFDIVDGQVVPVGERIAPPANELGWKDTVQAHPGQITRVIAKFEVEPGLYPYHCHILEHEDHEMMRQFKLVCPADYDTNGAVEVLDIFAFLTDWFANEPAAYNFGGTPGVPAIFAFLTAWFAGC